MGNKTTDQFYKYFNDYFIIGGFPAVQHLKEDERKTILQDYVNTVIFRDVIERYKISNTSLIKYLIKTLIKNAAQPFTVNKFFKDIKSQGFKVSKDTIYQYIDYLEDAFLIFTVPIFSESLRKIEQNPKKIYVVDNGLIKANTLSISKQLGSLFENQIYLDLRRENKKVSYCITEDGYEIDFVVEDQNGSFELIQAVWDISDEKTYQRELRALNQAEKELGIKGKIVTPKGYLHNFFNVTFKGSLPL